MTGRFYARALKYWRTKPVFTALFLSLATRGIWLAMAAAGVRWASSAVQEAADGEVLRKLPSPLFTMWSAWDHLFSRDVAQADYGGLVGERAFGALPLFSLLIRAIATLTHLSLPVTGFLVASVFDCVGWVLVARWLRRRMTAEQSFWAMLAFAVFPVRDFGLSAYSDGLFLTLSMAAFLSFDARYLGWTCVFSALAAILRPQGFLVGLALGVSSLLRLYTRPTHARGKMLWTALLLIVACPVGLLSYTNYLLHHRSVLDSFGRTPRLPLERPAARGWLRSVTGHAQAQDYGAMAVTGGTVVQMIRRKRRREDWLYLLFSMSLPLASGHVGNWSRTCGALPPLFVELGFSLTGRKKKGGYLMLAAIFLLGVAFRTGQTAQLF